MERVYGRRNCSIWYRSRIKFWFCNFMWFSSISWKIMKNCNNNDMFMSYNLISCTYKSCWEISKRKYVEKLWFINGLFRNFVSIFFFCYSWTKYIASYINMKYYFKVNLQLERQSFGIKSILLLFRVDWMGICMNTQLCCFVSIILMHYKIVKKQSY